jgi:hypothetical protein
VRLARGRLACEVTATDAPEATDASPADLSADRPKPSER